MRVLQPRMLYMWPNARIGVMGGEQAAMVLAQVQQERAFKSGTPIPEEKLEKLKAAVRKKYDAEARSL